MDKKSEFITLIVVLISIFIKIMGDLDIGSTDTINYRPTISTTFAKIVLTEPNNPNPEPNPENCPCEGTGYIIHGDGHKTECPCGENCNCTPSEEETEPLPRHTPLKNFFRGLFRKV